jgi:tetratricopeptide (TPR) repeat protein
VSPSLKVFVCATALSGAVAAGAQCPDGTPPPCGARRSSTGPSGPLVLVSDFRSAAADSAAARFGTDALRFSLDQSQFVRVMTPQTVADALRRMQRNPSGVLTLDAARELALREGAGLVLDGDVTRSDRGFTFVLRLITTDSASIIAVVPVTAASVSAIPDAMDRTARILRTRLGESVQKVRSSPPLAQVTTSSIEALQKYMAGARAHNVEQNFPKAVALLKEAVALDTLFAEAWRMLGLASANGGLASQAEISRYLAAAFKYRDRLTARERIRAEIFYYRFRDQEREYAASEEWFKLTEDSSGLAELAVILLQQREYERAERFAAAALRAGRNGERNIQVLVNALLYQGKVRQADSVVRAESRRPPNQLLAARYSCSRAPPKGCVTLEHALDSLRTSGRPGQQTGALGELSALALMRGKIALWRKLQSDKAELDKARGLVSRSPGPIAVYYANGIDVWLRDDRTPVGPRLDSVNVGEFVGSGFVGAELAEMARHYAWGGRPERARELLARLRAESGGTLEFQNTRARVMWAEAELALAEGHWEEAIAKFRAADVMPYNDNGPCGVCVGLHIAHVYAAKGERDSAIANYERAFTAPLTLTFGDVPWHMPMQYGQLCRLYAAAERFDRARPVCEKFVEYWEDADAELQPRVAEARRIIAKSKT